MAKNKIDITDEVISIYVEKYYGEKLKVIQQRYNVKCHSAIYFYCSIVEERSMFNKSLREKVNQKKDQYRLKYRSYKAQEQFPFKYAQLSFPFEY